MKAGILVHGRRSGSANARPLHTVATNAVTALMQLLAYSYVLQPVSGRFVLALADLHAYRSTNTRNIASGTVKLA